MFEDAVKKPKGYMLGANEIIPKFSVAFVGGWA
jgi:hypothetical protein